MGDQQVLRIERLAANLGIEIGAARLQATGLEDMIIGQRHFRHVVRELIGVPARLVVVAVHVDRAKDAKRPGQRQFVLERVAREDCVALLDIDLDLVFQSEVLQEAVNRRDVIVVLVLGRFLRLRLDQDGSRETDLPLVVDDH